MVNIYNLKTEEKYSKAQVDTESFYNAKNNVSRTESNINIIKDRFEKMDENVIDSLEDEMYAKSNINKTSKSDFEKEFENLNKSEKVLQNIDKLYNAITPEGYSELEELGLAPSKEEPSKLVTVYDRIQVQLATYCDDYKITGSRIDSDVIKEVNGTNLSEVISRKLEDKYVPATMDNINEVKSAFEKAENLTNIDKSSKEYLIKNDLELSINNIYRAEHSKKNISINSHKDMDNVMSENTSANKVVQSYAGIKATSNNAKFFEDIEKLTPQIENFLENNNFGVSLENLNKCKEILESKIPLTKENYIKNDTIEGNSIIEVTSNKEELLDMITTNMSFGKKAEDTVILKEKISLYMNLDSSKRLNTLGLEEQLDYSYNRLLELEKVASDVAKTMFEMEDLTFNEENISKYEEINKAVYDLKVAPIYISAEVFLERISSNLEQVSKAGTLLKDKLDKAFETYEAVGTKVRVDLKDNINKAFSNISDLLKEQNIKVNEDNIKAVKIMAYNQIAINEENVNKIVNINSEFQTLVYNLTPKAVVKLIKDQINPLEMDIKELNDYLLKEKIMINKNTESDTSNQENKEESRNDDSKNSLVNRFENTNEKIEKYSEFLYHLDKNKELTSEQREQYIGIYRLLNNIEKDDRSSISMLYKNGLTESSDIKLSDLLSALRIKASSQKEYNIDDGFGFLEKKEVSKTSFDLQFEGFYKNNVKKNSDKIIKQAVEELLETNEAINMENIAIKEAMITNKDEIFSQMKTFLPDKKKKNKTFSIDEAIEKLEENIESQKDLQTAFSELQEKVISEIEDRIGENHTEILDLNNLKRVGIVANIINNQSQKNIYNLPIKIEDEDVVISLRVKKAKSFEDKNKVSIELETGSLGKISAMFYLENAKVTGMILAERQETIDSFNDRLDEFQKLLGENNFEETNINISSKKTIESNNWDISTAKEDIDAKELFVVAKSFIDFIKAE